MVERNRPNPEVEAPRQRNSGLIAAILRISASRDVDTVLQEVVDSARALTGARYGVIATIDEAGRPHEHVNWGSKAEDARPVVKRPDIEDEVSGFLTQVREKRAFRGVAGYARQDY